MSYEAIKGMTGTVRMAKQTVNPDLQVLGIVINKYDWRAKLTKDVIKAAEKVAQALECKVLDAKVRRNVSIAEAAGKQMPVTAYAPGSNGAKDIRELCKEIEMEMKKHD